MRSIRIIKLAMLLTCLAPLGGVAQASIAFSDDFEDDLAAWTGQNGSAHNGIIVDDPLRAGNSVLTFTASQIGGDIFTAAQYELVAGQNYIISFEYLGLAQDGSVDGDLGGFAGMSEGLPGSHSWFYGTTVASSAQDILVDDGQWATYTFEFTAHVQFVNGGGVSERIRLMFEDFAGSGGVAGDVFFDNVELRAVPLPAAGWLFLGGLLTLFHRRRR